MKRFTETAKWEDPWFRRLSPEMKLLWQWLLDRCDNAGIIDPDIELASFQIGYQYPMDTLSRFGDRVEQLECGKWFIPKFIQFQYGQLSEDCKAHKPVFQSLEKHGIQRVSKGYQYPPRKGKGIGIGKDSSRRPTLEQAKSAASMIGVSPEKADEWWHAREASEWMKGMAGGGTSPVGTNWQADLKTYATRTNGSQPDQKKKPKSAADYGI